MKSGASALAEIPVDPRLQPGAANGVHTCLRVQRGERVVVVTDRRTIGIAATFYHELLAAGAQVTAFVLEDLARRPLRNAPGPILDALLQTDAALYCVWVQKGEMHSRMQVTGLAELMGIRYAHMINITPEIMMQGMRADFEKVDEIGRKVLERASRARIIEVTTKAGTDLRATFSPDLRWINTSGLIRPPYWSNLPGGEVFTCPASVDGTFVVDGTVGEYLSEKYGLLTETPLTIEIHDSRIKIAHCDNRQLLKDFLHYVRTDVNSNRVGEFAIGTNLAIPGLVGNLLQDEKVPGVHIAFGDPYGSQTRARWRSSTHIDVISTGCTVLIDNDSILEAGEFRLDKLGVEYTVCPI